MKNPLLPFQLWLDAHPIVQNYLYDLVPIVTVLLIAIALLKAGQQPLWAEAYRRIRRRPVALGAVIVICLYGAVAFADSIGWYDAKSQERVTLLDTVAKREKERYYSAPGATMTTGEAFPKPLKEKHLLGTDGKGADGQSGGTTVPN